MAEEAKMALFTCVVGVLVTIIGIIYNDRTNNWAHQRAWAEQTKQSKRICVQEIVPVLPTQKSRLDIAENCRHYE